MTFKEFMAWCNYRACDGCWGMQEALLCIEVGREVKKQPLWKREKTWQKLNAENGIEEIIEILDQKRKEVFRNG